jgi:hypothetical protein
MSLQLNTLTASIALALAPPPRKPTMSFDAIKQDALALFRAAVIGIHAQFANTLVQAGHAVSEESTASELLNSAAGAANTIGKPAAANAAPNYADFALHAFMVSMEHAAVNFAAAHLPDKYKPVMGAITAEVQAAVTGQPVSEAQVVDAVVDAAGAAVDIAEPELAPIVTLAEPIVENEAVELLHAQPISEPVVPTAEPGAPVISPFATHSA